MAPSQMSGETPSTAEFQAGDADKKSEATLRVKTGSGALATVDPAPPGMFASAEKAAGKYYGPRHASAADDEPGANMPAQQRALSLADALTEYYAKTGEPQPPMYTTDRATLQRIIDATASSTPRADAARLEHLGHVAPGRGRDPPEARLRTVHRICSVQRRFSDRCRTTIRAAWAKAASRPTFLAEHLEYFDVTARQWAPLQRSRMKLFSTNKIDEGALPVTEDAAAVKRPDLALDMVHGFLRHILQSLEADAEPWQRQLALHAARRGFRSARHGRWLDLLDKLAMASDALGEAIARNDPPGEVGQGVLPHLATPIGALAERREAAKTDAKQNVFLKRYAPVLNRLEDDVHSIGRAWAIFRASRPGAPPASIPTRRAGSSAACANWATPRCG